MLIKGKFILIGIIVLAFVVRLYRLNFPLADWHSWRQADTAAVSRRYLDEGINLLYPRYDDLSSIPSGRENPQGWRFVEFPLYNGLHTLVSKIFPVFSFEVWGRLLSNLISLGSLYFLYLIVKKLLDKKTALFSAFFFAFLPFNIYYSRTILPEPVMVFFSLTFIYFFVCWIESVGKKASLVNLGLFSLFLSLAILTKPFVVFLGLPLLYFAFKNLKFKLIRLDLFLGVLLALILFAAWRWWESHFPAGIPDFTWLFNSTGIRFRPAFFRWLFAERLGKLILGYWGAVFFVLGLVKKPEEKEGWFFHWWLLSILLYFAIFATGNVTHDYYQIIAIPIISVFLAKGSVFLISLPKNLVHRFTVYCLLITVYLFLFSFSWFHVRDFFNINHPEIVEAGEAVDRLAPKEALVVAPYGGDTAFLYQTKRKGWPVGGAIEDKVKRGAAYFVSVNFDEETTELMRRCPILLQKEKFVIINLKDCLKP